MAGTKLQECFWLVTISFNTIAYKTHTSMIQSFFRARLFWILFSQLLIVRLHLRWSWWQLSLRSLWSQLVCCHPPEEALRCRLPPSVPGGKSTLLTILTFMLVWASEKIPELQYQHKYLNSVHSESGVKDLSKGCCANRVVNCIWRCKMSKSARTQLSRF